MRAAAEVAGLKVDGRENYDRASLNIQAPHAAIDVQFVVRNPNSGYASFCNATITRAGADKEIVWAMRDLIPRLAQLGAEEQPAARPSDHT
uniref:hypothetical protein n=1 Tax=Herbidospora sakaeratensis TaxID=564415 RepID=UPI0007834432|nr:hypothetical protein [Herbidospora sakaeratensis]